MYKATVGFERSLCTLSNEIVGRLDRLISDYAPSRLDAIFMRPFVRALLLVVMSSDRLCAEQSLAPSEMGRWRESNPHLHAEPQTVVPSMPLVCIALYPLSYTASLFALKSAFARFSSSLLSLRYVCDCLFRYSFDQSIEVITICLRSLRRAAALLTPDQLPVFQNLDTALNCSGMLSDGFGYRSL